MLVVLLGKARHADYCIGRDRAARWTIAARRSRRARSMTPISHPRRRYPLYVHLSVLFSALVLATGAAIAWLGYAESRDVALAAADETFDHVGRETQSSLREALQPVAHLAELLALQPIARAGSLADRLDALPVMRLGFAGDAPVAAAYVGYDDGAFFLLRPLRDEPARALFQAPAGSAYLVQSVEVAADGSRTAGYLFLDAGLRELARRVPAPYEFDPRGRPWYRLAAEPGKRVLTEPYAFFTTGSPGMTVAIRTAWGSVVGIDVTFDQVSQRLAALRTLPGMKVALFDAERRVIALADPTRTMVRRDGDRVSLATLDEIGEPALASLRAIAPGAAPASRTVVAGDVRWKSAVLPIQTVRGTLSLGIVAPLDSLLAGARAIRLRGLAATLAVLAIAIPLTGWVARRVSKALARITREAEDIRAFRFDGPSAGASPVLEIDQLSGAVDMMRNTIRNFLDIAGSLAAETNAARLLDRVVSETSATMGFAGGVAYLPDERGTLQPASLVGADGQHLDATVGPQRPDDGSPVAEAFRTGRTVVAPVAPVEEGPLAFAHRLWPGGAVVVTAIPLVDRAREKVGVLALFRPGTARPSTAELAFVEALSGTAAVAIETQRLLEARKALLDAFIRLVAGAIDAKSPYTGGHCERVPELTLMLARAACDATEGRYRDFALTDEEWEAVQIAAWLHDCGKVTTPEYVVDKATKLETIYDRIHEVRMRFEVLKRDAEIAFWREAAGGGDRAAAQAALDRERAALDEEFSFVAGCNEGGEFMDPAKVERLKSIAARTWLRTLDDRVGISQDEKARKDRTTAPPLPVAEPLLADRPEHVIARAPGEAMPADNRWGFRLKVPEHQYNRGELYNLAIARGTLTEEDRYVINHHIVQTIVMLSQLPFPKHLRNVPEIAGGHHEKMDGTGYPKGLRAGDMSPVARMMAIADIFEALTAADRPYKKAKKLSEALRIMGFMKRDRHVDPELFDLFLTSGVYRRYAERFLRPEQLDEVDIAPLLGPVPALAPA
jgi:HD-GYP domain-containing protein (c-di-GMP phosphodiesterase class II)